MGRFALSDTRRLTAKAEGLAERTLLWLAILGGEFGATVWREEVSETGFSWVPMGECWVPLR